MKQIGEQLGRVDWDPTQKLTALEFDALAAQVRQEVEAQGWEWATQDFTQGALAFYTPFQEAASAQRYLKERYGCIPAEDFEFEQHGRKLIMSDPVDDRTGFSPQVGRYKMFDAANDRTQMMFRVTVRNPE